MKIGIGAAFIGALVWGLKATRSALANFTFDIVAYGSPKFSGSFITVPLSIKFSNPTPLPISLDQVEANAFINKNGQWVHAATVNQPITIPPGESFQIVSPSLNVGSIFGGDLLTTLVSLSKTLANKTLDISTDVNIIYNGIRLPKKTFTNQIKL